MGREFEIGEIEWGEERYDNQGVINGN